MNDSQTASELLAQAILKLGSPEFANALGRWLRTACRFDNFTVIAFFNNRAPIVYFAQADEPRVFERMDSHYLNGAYLLDPFFDLHKTGAAEGLYRLSDIAPDRFERNEYFSTYYSRTTLIDELAFFSCPVPGVSVTVCIGRDATTGQRFSARDLAAARDVSVVVNALVKSDWSELPPIDVAEPDDVSRGIRERLAVETGISLSPRQSEIALLILKGHSSVSIGLTLGISPLTVKVIRKQLYRKCRISSQGELYFLIAPYLMASKTNAAALAKA